MDKLHNPEHYEFLDLSEIDDNELDKLTSTLYPVYVKPNINDASGSAQQLALEPTVTGHQVSPSPPPPPPQQQQQQQQQSLEQPPLNSCYSFEEPPYSPSPSCIIYMPSNDAFYTNNNNNNDVVKDRNQFIDPNDDQVEPTDNSVCQGCQSVIDPSNDTSISDIDGDDDGDGNTRPIYCDTPNSQCSSSVSNQNSHHTDDVSSYVTHNNVPYNPDPNQDITTWTISLDLDHSENYVDMSPHANGSGINNNQQQQAQTNIPPQNQQQQQQQQRQQPSPQQLYQPNFVGNQMGMYHMPVQYLSNVAANVNVGYMGHNVPSPGAYMTAAAPTYIPVDVQQAGQQQQVQPAQAQSPMDQSPTSMGMRGMARRGRGRINSNHRREFNPRQPNATAVHPAEMMGAHGVDPQQIMTQPAFSPYYYPPYASAYYSSSAISHTGGGHPSAQHATGTPIYHLPMYAPTQAFYNYPPMIYPPMISSEYQTMEERGDEHADGVPNGVPQMWPQMVMYNPHAHQQMHPSQMHPGPPLQPLQTQSQDDYLDMNDDNQNTPHMQQSPHMLSPRSDMSQIHHSMEYLPQQSPVMVEVATPSPIPTQMMQSPQDQPKSMQPAMVMVSIPQATVQQPITYAEPVAASIQPMRLNIVCDVMPTPDQQQHQQQPPQTVGMAANSPIPAQTANQNYLNNVNNNYSNYCDEYVNPAYNVGHQETQYNTIPPVDPGCNAEQTVPCHNAIEIINENPIVLVNTAVQNQVVPNSNVNTHNNTGGAPPSASPAAATSPTCGFMQSPTVMKKPVTSIATTTTQEDVNSLVTATSEKLMIKNDRISKPPAWNNKKATASVAVTAVPSADSIAISPKQPTLPPFQNHNNKLMTQKQQTVSETKSTASTAAPQDLPDKEFKAINSNNSQIIITPTTNINKPVTIIHKDQEVQLPLAPPPPPPSVIAAASETSSAPSWASLLKVNAASSPVASNLAELPKKPVAKISPFADRGATPPGGMSYSAASAQGLSGPPLQHDSRPMRRVEPPKPVGDELLNKLGDFFRKYRTENNNVSLKARGLTNRSNYCYINAILQALVGCPQFYNLIRSIPVQTATLRQKSVAPTIEAMIELMSEFSHLPPGARLHRREKTQKKEDVGYDLACDPSFEPTAIHKLWNGSRQDVEGRQEDAEEFLSHLLNKINDEMLELMKMTDRSSAGIIVQPQNGAEQVTTETKDDGDEWQLIYGSRNKGSVTRSTDFGRTPVSDIFRGELRSRLQREGDHVTDEIQPFFTLQLNIEKAASVKEALDILVGKDKLEGVTCSKTNQEVPAWQQMYLEKLPIVLILHLKWFSYKVDGCSKIVKNVDFPIELKIDSKILSSKKYTPKQKAYKLFAVVYHDGKEASKGHYITDVYHFGYSSWLRYDDSSVKPINENAVLHPRNPRVPYLLYYRRCDTLA